VFKSHKPKTIPGLLDFVAKVVEMGLQDFIVLSEKTLQQNHTSNVKKDTNNSEKWWFLN
jgi:hypothetical protein